MFVLVFFPIKTLKMQPDPRQSGTLQGQNDLILI